MHGGVWALVESHKVDETDSTHIRSYLRYLYRHLETLKVSRRGLEGRLNRRLQKCRIALFLGIREECERYGKRIEREVAAQDVRGRVGKMEFIEAAVRHTEVGFWVAPAAQSAQRVTVLPER